MTKLEAWLDKAKKDVEQFEHIHYPVGTLEEAIAVIEKLMEFHTDIKAGYHCNIQECMNLSKAALAIDPEKL